MNSRLIRYMTPALIILAGALIMTGLIVTRKKPRQNWEQPSGALVEVVTVERAARTVVVEGNGTVTPRYEIVLMPQVAGKITWAHPNLVAGGTFQEGDKLLRIDPADYLLAVRQASAQVAQAELQIEIARANAAIAHREWELMNSSRDHLTGVSSESPSEPDPLVLHEPQLRQADANLISARAALEMTQLNLERTELRAPFNCRVRSQSIAPGQLVGPSSRVATLYGTDMAEIEIGLSVAELAWIEVPGSPVRVVLDTGEATYTWMGQIDRSVGVADEIGRLTRVVVRVINPFDPSVPGGPELSMGSFVSVNIIGRELENTIPIPRAALRENSTVWVVADDGTLEIRKVTLHRQTPTEALVAMGLESGDRIVLTPLAGAASGTRLRPVARDSTRLR